MVSNISWFLHAPMWRDIQALSAQLELDPGAVDDDTTKAATFANYRAHQLWKVGKWAVAKGFSQARERDAAKQRLQEKMAQERQAQARQECQREIQGQQILQGRGPAGAGASSSG
jgi:hypothetical protein